MGDFDTDTDNLDFFDFGGDDFLGTFLATDDSEDDEGAESDFDLGVFQEDADKPFETRYQRPKVTYFDSDAITSDNARKLAVKLPLKKNERADAIISGSFIFGDFIEQYIRAHAIHVEKLTIATLSLSQDNVDSLDRLLQERLVERLDLIVSSYFYSHEQHPGGLIPRIYAQLDTSDRFRLAVCGSHCKVTLLDTQDGRRIVLHGSANLRSSSNIEQMCLEENADLFSFYSDAFTNIVERYNTINHEIRNKELFREVSRKRFD